MRQSKDKLISSFRKFVELFSKINKPDVYKVIEAMNKGFINHYGEILRNSEDSNMKHVDFNLDGLKCHIDYIVVFPGEDAYELGDNVNTLQIQFLCIVHNENDEIIERIELLKFAHKHCNPDFIYILEKAILEIT